MIIVILLGHVQPRTTCTSSSSTYALPHLHVSIRHGKMYVGVITNLFCVTADGLEKSETEQSC